MALLGAFIVGFPLVVLAHHSLTADTATTTFRALAVAATGAASRKPIVDPTGPPSWQRSRRRLGEAV